MINIQEKLNNFNKIKNILKSDNILEEIRKNIISSEIIENNNIFNFCKKNIDNNYDENIEYKNLINLNNYLDPYILDNINYRNNNTDEIIEEDTEKINQLFNTFNDVEFFYNYNNTNNNTVFSNIDNTYTLGGRLFLKNFLENPLYDIDILNKRQYILNKLINSNINTENLSNSFKNIKNNESSIHWMLGQNDNEMNSLIDMLYFNNYVFKKLNNLPFALTITNLHKIIFSPLIGILTPIMYVIIPFLVLKYKLKIKIGFIPYVKMMYNYYIKMNFINSLSEKNFKIRIMKNIWTSFTILFYFNGIFNSIEISKLTYKINNFVCNEINKGVSFIKHSLDVIDILYNKEDIEYFFRYIDYNKTNYNNWIKLYKKDIDKDLNCSIIKFFIKNKNFGSKLKLFKTFNKNNLKNLLNIIYQCDVIFSIINLINYKNLTKTELLNLKNPHIEIVGLNHPCILNNIKNNIKLNNKNNLLITGPNAGGKSTFIKSICINILLSQTITFNFCDKLSITPFYYISSQMNIVDEKGVYSLFESEMYRILNNLDQVIKNNKLGKFSILFLDELFNSTNVIEGISGSYSICKKLASLNSNITLLTTHFTYLYKLENDSNFKNYKMNAIVEDNKIKFPYKIHSGYSTQYIAIELLKNENNISKYENISKDIFDDAIKYKKKLLNLKKSK